jgi:hypothetical protein
MVKDDVVSNKEAPAGAFLTYKTMILKKSQNGKIILIYTDKSRTSLIVETIVIEWDNGEPSIQSSSISFDAPTANRFTDMLCDIVPSLRK